MNVPTHSLHPPKFILRPVRTDTPEYEELYSNIERDGVKHPLIVRPIGDDYEIIDGIHRWTIAKAVGLETVPVHVITCDDDHVVAESIRANTQGVKMTTGEKIRALKEVMRANPGISMRKLASLVGKSPSYVCYMLKIEHLPPWLKKNIEEGTIPLTSGIALGNLPREIREAGYVQAARDLPASTFTAMAAEALNDFKRATFDLRCEAWMSDYQHEPSLKPLNEVEKHVEARGEVIRATGATTVVDGWDAAIAWVTNSDPISIEKLKQHHLQRQVKLNQKRIR